MMDEQYIKTMGNVLFGIVFSTVLDDGKTEHEATIAGACTRLGFEAAMNMVYGLGPWEGKEAKHKDTLALTSMIMSLVDEPSMVIDFPYDLSANPEAN